MRDVVIAGVGMTPFGRTPGIGVRTALTATPSMSPGHSRSGWSAGSSPTSSSTAVALAARIASEPRRAVEATKQALRASWAQDLQGSINASYWTVAALYYGEDVREGVVAALEKRGPKHHRDVHDQGGS